MSLTDGVKSFLFEYFWLPVVDPAVHYNVYNTAVYALLFGAAAIYLGYPVIKKLGLDLDREFFIGIAPFVFLGGSVRALRDIQVLDTILLETPFIYILMFFFTLGSLLISLKFQKIKGISYHKIFSTLGLSALIISLMFFRVENWDLLAGFILVSMAWITLGYLLLRSFAPEYLDWAFTLPIAAHFFDASSTYVGITLSGAEEKHVLADTVMQMVGAWGIFLVKAAIIVPVVWIIYQDFEGDERNYYLFLVALLGFAITTRNMLSIV